MNSSQPRNPGNEVKDDTGVVHVNRVENFLGQLVAKDENLVHAVAEGIVADSRVDI
jgi:hypothetical protein